MKVITAQEYQGEDFDGSTGFYVVNSKGVALDYFDTEVEAYEFIKAKLINEH